ncbi:uncharacterized protein LAESUDRAFT_548819 [Laetiporus sulphureus 93-53]|uniref:PH domain-containing protein n=1 Tax=Laetiporus sulphureus 93-53 TaxID=1314785 RepID=A0A165FS26_9APHY|nr:uncharacterized protein LAESUDRAFT_548819 [Laetiporus sulphureus 93-53]KZT09338.1 hypothetical protein LAESUDRAFT_548819 [Laetiporus sulphureus 93-53]
MASRPTSSAVFTRPLFFSSLDDAGPSRRASKQPDRDDRPFSRSSRRSSLQPSRTTDPFTAHPTGSGSFLTYDGDSSPMVVGTSSSSQPLSSFPKRARNSLLLSFARPKSSRGAKKKAAAQPEPNPFMFGEVIEISAEAEARKLDEDAERERLRDAAAQSIGLDPILLESHSISEDDDDNFFDEQHGQGSSGEPRTANTTPTPPFALPPPRCTLASLEPFIQLRADLHRHYAPLSLLKLTLARQWKPRFLVLSSSTSAATPSSPTTSLACLHLFKNNSPDEGELERLEVGADSVVFVAEEEVGGRRGIVRIKGAGLGSRVTGTRKDSEGREMALHFADPTKAQELIAVIKQAVLSQRSLRAGLGVMPHSPSGGSEPRGDLDVMLSMRAQGMLVPGSPASSSFPPSAFSPTSNGLTLETSTSLASSTGSQRSASGTRSPASTGGVAALRGLFSGSGASARPRSPSSVSTTTAEWDVDSDNMSHYQHSHSHSLSTHLGGHGHQHEDSFGRVGSSLLSMFRVGGERPMSPATRPRTPASIASACACASASASVPSTPRIVEPPAPPAIVLDRKIKILQEKDLEMIEGLPFGSSYDAGLLRGRNHLSMQAMRGAGAEPALQPAPRRPRANTASGVDGRGKSESGFGANGNMMNGSRSTYTHANESTAESFGLGVSNGNGPGTGLGLRQPNGSWIFAANPPASPRTGSSFGQAQDGGGRPRTSLSSMSSYGSEEMVGSANPKRWSRQGSQTARLTPPPEDASSSAVSFRAQRHPYAAETGGANLKEGLSRSPSSPYSFVSGLRDFSKRASGSSARSVSSCGGSLGGSGSASGGGSLLVHQNTHQHQHRPRSAHRASMPPPQRPAPLIALPPTPADESPSPSLNSMLPDGNKTSLSPSLRASLSLRSRNHRLSLSPPKLPPSSELPPRPDEPAAGNGMSVGTVMNRSRRSGSIGSSGLETIPASPSSPASSQLTPPYPPPSGPLPPTPETQATQTTQAPSRSSIKKRLRMLSSPGPSASPQPSVSPQSPPSPAPSTINPYVVSIPIPSTPIGEPIVTLTKDATNLLLSSAPTPPLPLAIPIPPVRSSVMAPELESCPDLEGVTSLSPPPRRSSRRVSKQEQETMEMPEMQVEPQLPMSLSSPTLRPAGPEACPPTPPLSTSLSAQTSAVSLVEADLHVDDRSVSVSC